MPRFSSIFRLVALGVALAQFVLAGAFPMLDAQLEIESRRVAEVHYESTSAPCGVVHHAADCAICNLLARWSGPLSRPTVVPPIEVAVLPLPHFEAPQPVVLPHHRLILPRAPPTIA